MSVKTTHVDRPLMCRLGLHKWLRDKGKGYRKCKRCKKVQYLAMGMTWSGWWDRE